MDVNTSTLDFLLDLPILLNTRTWMNHPEKPKKMMIHKKLKINFSFMHHQVTGLKNKERKERQFLVREKNKEAKKKKKSTINQKKNVIVMSLTRRRNQHKY